MKRSSILLTLLGFVTAAVAVVVAPSAWADGNRAVANDNPAFLQVYNNNVENLPTAGLADCPGDWQDLVYYMKLQKFKPDVYTVQQVSSQKQLNKLTAFMSKQLGETYKGVIAQASPKKMNSPCGPKKDYQTNAIIYRDKRLSFVKKDTWQVQAENSAGNCPDNTQARTVSVKGLFKDKASGKKVTVASIHWPTGKSGGPACASDNAAELKRKLTADGFGADLLVVGGDLNFNERNDSGDWRPWYDSLNGQVGGARGFRDVVFSACKASTAPLRACLNDNWTIGSKKRIDFVFAKTGQGALAEAKAVHTVGFDEGDAADRKLTGSDRGDRSYSQHRAISARVHY